VTAPPDGTALPDGTRVPRFAGPATFTRVPTIDAVHSFDLAVLGLPFDGGTSYRPGARFGPMAVRQASRHLRPGFHVELDRVPYAHASVVDAGDVPCTPFGIEEAVAQMEGWARDVVGTDGSRRVVAIGGDHTVALPMLRAAHAAHGPVALVHFDAHLDTWDAYFGSRVTHGTVFRRAFEEGLLAPDRSVHLGIRGPLYDRGDLVADTAVGFRAVRTHEIDLIGPAAALELVRERVGDAPVYVSVDIDVLDPAFAPGTGTPEMGGLTSRELLRLLRGLGDLHLVGGDVVEVAPAYDHAEITALAGATVAFELLALMAGAGR
jgi:agmatinase